MKEDKKALFAHLAGMAVSTGLAIFTQGSSQLMLGVLNSISSNLASSFIEKAEYSRVRKLIGNYDPSELNHDLRKLIIDAVEWAIRNIGILYKKNLSDKKQTSMLRAIIGDLQKQIRSYAETASQKDSEWLELAERPRDIDAVMEAFKLNSEAMPVISTEIPFNKFFRDQLIPQVKLCFGELLKSPRNRSAYIAYQRQVYDNIDNRIEELLAKNTEVLKTLNEKLSPGETPPEIQLRGIQEKIRTTEPGEREKYVDKALEEYLAPVQRELAVLLDITKNIDSQLGSIRHSTVMFEKKLDQNWISKNKLLVFFLTASLIFVVAAGIYYLRTRPFNMIVSIKKQEGLITHPAYPSPGAGATLVLELPGRAESFTPDGAWKIIVGDLPADANGMAVKAVFNDPFWKLNSDSIVIGRVTTVGIRPNEKLSRVYGVVRSWDGSTFISKARIAIDNDTLIYSNANGYFDIVLPESLRKAEYHLIVSADGYVAMDDSRYYPGTPVEFRLKKSTSTQ